MNRLRALALLVVAAVVTPSAAKPADITYKCYTDRCAIQLKGDIEEGDFERFSNVVEEINSTGLPVSGVILLSRGGNVSEAMKIGRLVRASLMTARIPENSPSIAVSQAPVYQQPSVEGGDRLIERLLLGGFDYFVGATLDSRQISNSRKLVDIATAHGWEVSFDTDAICASACALIAISAVRRLGGPVGLHHIYVENKDIDFSDLNSVLSSGTSEVSSFLTEMRAPSSFLNIMVSTPSQEMEWFDLPPYDPIYQEFQNARCPGLTTAESNDQLNLLMLREIGSYMDDTGNSIRRDLSNAELRYLDQLEARAEVSRNCQSELYVSTWRKAQGLD
jgi:hypothetical protein